MRDARVNGYDEVHLMAKCRGISKIKQCLTQMQHARTIENGAFGFSQALLQGDKLKAWVEQPLELSERD